MDEAAWDVCPDAIEMLNFLQTRGWGSGRKLRLVCCALCRAVAHLITDKRHRRALDVAERYADGLAGVGDLRKAHGVVGRFIRHTEEYEWSEDKQGMLLALNAVSWATTLREPPDPPAYLAGAAALVAKCASEWEGLRKAKVRASQSALLRDILGNPFRPVRQHRHVAEVAAVVHLLGHRHEQAVVTRTAGRKNNGLGEATGGLNRRTFGFQRWRAVGRRGIIVVE